MVFPFNTNKIEQLELDPTKQINGYVWFNTVEKVYKTWVDGQLQIFLTAATFGNDLPDLVKNTLEAHQFTISFTDAYSINVKHNRNSIFFNYNIFDTELNSNLAAHLEIIDENEVKVDFVDPVTGYLFMYFQ